MPQRVVVKFKLESAFNVLSTVPGTQHSKHAINSYYFGYCCCYYWCCRSLTSFTISRANVGSPIPVNGGDLHETFHLRKQTYHYCSEDCKVSQKELAGFSAP